MSTIPLPALDIKPVVQQNPLDTYAKVMSLKSMQQQQQLQGQQMQQGQQEIQKNQFALDDQTKMREISSDPSIDWTKPDAIQGMLGKAAQSGVSPQTLMSIRSTMLEQQTKLATLDKTTLENTGTKIDNLYTSGKGILALPAEQRPAAYAQMLTSQPPDVLQHLPPQYPGDDQFAASVGTLGISHNMVAAVARDRQATTGEQKQANEAPGQIATSDQKARQDTASRLAMAKDQPSYDALRAQLPFGIAKQFPDVFDRATVLQAGMTPDQTVATGLAADQRAETARHNQADEKATANGQAITVRGQNLVNARSVEANRNQTVQGNMGLSGADYLATLPQTTQANVRMIGEGRAPLSRIDYLLSKNPALMAMVGQAYPGYDASKVKAYMGTTTDFTSGRTSVAINAGATALGHLQELQQLNTAASHIPHTPAWTAYQNKATTVSTELAKFYGDSTIPAIEQIKSTLTSTLPGNRAAAIHTQAQSMGDKFDSFEQQWANAAPNPTYQAAMPGMSQKAKAARAALDPNYAARVNGHQQQQPQGQRQGQMPGAGGGGMPRGATHVVPGSDGKMHYTDGRNDLGAVQ